MPILVWASDVASGVRTFIRAGGIQTIFMLVLRICQIGWALQVLLISAGFTCIVVAQSTGLIEKAAADWAFGIIAYPMLVCVTIYAISFNIRCVFIKISPDSLTQSDFVDHLCACRMFFVIMVFCSNKSPRSQALWAMCLLNVEYKLSRVSLNRGSRCRQ